MIILSFTDQGLRLQNQLLKSYPQAKTRRDQSSADFVAEHFSHTDVIIFIGACGIAVRLIAPHITSKATDPAVLVIDEAGQVVISLLSGHLGGANQWAEEVAEAIGARPIITTASDLRGLFSIDDWARRQGFHVANPDKILGVAKKVLAGEKIKLKSEVEIEGEWPDIFRLADDEPDVIVSYQAGEGALRLIAPVIRLGSGCRKQTDPTHYQQEIDSFLDHYRIHPKALIGLYSIDLKADESAMIRYAFEKNIPFVVYDPADLTEEIVSDRSDFVAQVTGIDNVCERCANHTATGLVGKTILSGVTAALGIKKVRLK